MSGQKKSKQTRKQRLQGSLSRELLVCVLELDLLPVARLGLLAVPPPSLALLVPTCSLTPHPDPRPYQGLLAYFLSIPGILQFCSQDPHFRMKEAEVQSCPVTFPRPHSLAKPEFAPEPSGCALWLCQAASHNSAPTLTSADLTPGDQEQCLPWHEPAGNAGQALPSLNLRLLGGSIRRDQGS